MTYGELLDELQCLTHEQLNQDVTILVMGLDQMYPLIPNTTLRIADAESTDVLDPGHPYLTI